MFVNGYVVFCRLVGLEKADNPRIAYAFVELTRILKAQCDSFKSATVHTSVFGRFAVVRCGAVDAIRLATNVVSESMAQNVDVTIGIASGPIQEVNDLEKMNWVGHSINLGARLACVDSTPGSIAVGYDVVSDCQEADSDLAKLFGPKTIGKVKSTTLDYCQIHLKFRSSNRPVMAVRSETAHIVLYDIVKFSEQAPIHQADLAERLRRRVNIALHSVGGLTLENEKSCYASGGDGGALVFRDGHQSGAIRVWTFAKSLRDCSRDLPIRIGIATGQVVFSKEAPPLGQGIFRADKASSFPETGGICCHSLFWNRELGSENQWGWTSTSVEAAPEFLILESHADSKPPTDPESSISRQGPKPAPDRLPDTGEHLVGRDEEIALLEKAWRSESTRFVQIVAEGGVGKTQLVKKWRNRLLSLSDRGGVEQYFDWSFSSLASVDDFFQCAMSHFEVPAEIPRFNNSWARADGLAKAIKSKKTLLILDSTEVLQQFDGVVDVSLGNLFDALRYENSGMCVLTTRVPLKKLEAIGEPSSVTIELKNLSPASGADLLGRLGVRGKPALLQEASKSVENHALSVILLGTFLRNRHNGDAARFREVILLHGEETYAERAARMIESYEEWFGEQGEKGKAAVAILRLMGVFDRPADSTLIGELRKEPAIEGFTDALLAQQDDDLIWNRAVERLRDARLLAEDNQRSGTLDAHPLIREYYAGWLNQHEEIKRAANLRLYNRLIQDAERLENDDKAKRQLLCRAISHGCRAGLFQAVFRDLLGKQILNNDPRLFYQHPDLTMSLVFQMREFLKPTPFSGAKFEPQELYLTRLRDRARFQVWYSHCLAAYHGFIHPDVKTSFQQAVQLAQGRLPLRRELIAALVGLFRCQLFLAEFEDADHTVAEMEDATRFPFPWRLLIPKDVQTRAANTVLQARAETEFYLGNFDRCAELTDSFFEAIVVNQASYFEMDPIVALSSIACWCNFYLGNASKSVNMAERAVAQAESLTEGTTLQIDQSLAMASYHAGLIYYEMGNAEWVEQESKRLTRVAERLISPFWAALSDCLKAFSSRLKGEIAEAERLLFKGIQTWERMASRAMTRFWTILAEYRLQLGRWNEACEAIEKAEEYTISGEHFYLSEVQRVRALIRGGSPSGRRENGISEFQRSIETAQRKNALALELRTVNGYAECLMRSGDHSGALSLLMEILKRYNDEYETEDLRKAKSLCDQVSNNSVTNPATDVRLYENPRHPESHG